MRGGPIRLIPIDGRSVSNGRLSRRFFSGGRSTGAPRFNVDGTLVDLSAFAPATIFIVLLMAHNWKCDLTY